MQFHAYRLAGGALVLDLQSDLVRTPARAVAPLEPADDAPRPLPQLEPVLDVLGRRHVLRTGRIAALPAKAVSGVAVADLRGEDYAIRKALDLLFSGF